MQIGPDAPFVLSEDEDGTRHAVKDNIKITVLPDVNDVDIKHKYAVQPQTGKEARWLKARVNGLYVYVHGTHVVITKDSGKLPTFKDKPNSELLEDTLSKLKIVKDEKGRYVANNEHNRNLIAQALETSTDVSRRSTMAWVREKLGRILDL